MSVKVITDSTSYIPKNMVEELSIGIIPLRVSFDEETFVENEITNDFFYKKLDEKGEIPISSQPSIDFFYNMFEKEIKIGNEIVGVFISADMSGTFSTAVMVKNMILKEYPKAKIKILNSKF
ncbi:DegV family EDD domain-containing protein [Oceanotoga teriensis]|nr:DegV family protein [Oceanotoga teriensis]MDO7976941.1 DegV family EDD domain-containing protein [Oceanotoga teriensis]